MRLQHAELRWAQSLDGIQAACLDRMEALTCPCGTRGCTSRLWSLRGGPRGFAAALSTLMQQHHRAGRRGQRWVGGAQGEIQGERTLVCRKASTAWLAFARLGFGGHDMLSWALAVSVLGRARSTARMQQRPRSLHPLDCYPRLPCSLQFTSLFGGHRKTLALLHTAIVRGSVHFQATIRQVQPETCKVRVVARKVPS
jgi:hypothetical protein